MSFQMLGLAEPIARALAESGYATPTPIQTAAIPEALAGRDLVGIAQTGTGKTAAFALPILQRLAIAPRRPRPRTCRILVLSPTRELSAQIAEAFTTYGKHLSVSVALVIGGTPMGRQVRILNHGVDVLVATPGRLIDLCNSRAVSLQEVDVLVLDEADRMLDMGFIADIRRIVAMLPRKRQTLLFSATMPAEIATLAREILSDPLTIGVSRSASPVAAIDQRVVHVSPSEKPDALAELLTREPVERALVFTRTKRGADKVVRVLAKSGIAAEAIHGNKSQGQRERALASFRGDGVRNLIATDIAARGIDVAGISHVINYDLPNIPESYVHRIGRTARAGKTGVAISLCTPEEVPFLRAIEKVMRRNVAVVRSGRFGGEPTGLKAPQPAAKAPAAARPARPHGVRPAPSRQTRPDNIGSAGFMKRPRRIRLGA